MHSSVSRVIDAARRAGLEIRVERFPEGTRTAVDAAAAIGCEVDQIVKSLVFVADEAPMIALVSGADRVDVQKLGVLAGADAVRRAASDEARDATGFTIGGIPPFGHAQPLTVLVDRGLMGHEVVWAAAGRPDSVFSIRPDDLVRASGGLVGDLAAAR
jgi:prolyl-tRNA editing enzyme YbaK/EbsC (Cys-tRNA(Pro) deacylase)